MSSSIDFGIDQFEVSIRNRAESVLEVFSNGPLFAEGEIEGLIAAFRTRLERAPTSHETSVLVYEATRAILDDPKREGLAKETMKQLKARNPKHLKAISKAWRDHQKTLDETDDFQSKDIVSPKPEELATLTAFLEKYFPDIQILEKLGKGKFGTAWKGFNKKTQIPVTIKVLTNQNGNSSKELFKQEEATIRTLNHPNVRKIIDYEADETLAIQILEFVDGVSLKDFLIEKSREKEKIEFSDIVRFASRMADALSHVHFRESYHFDLKPDNILLANGNILEPKIIDFGLTIPRSERARYHKTCPMGTPLYMSPEQTVADYRDVTARTNVWSLGVILYEMVTGKTPFDGDFVRIREQNVLSLPELSEDWRLVDLDRVIQKCLQKKPEGRYENMLSLRSDLDKLLPIIPYGMQPFDEGAADYFCRLLPGGDLPASLQILRQRILTDKNARVKVIQIHGLSGCGKSSIVNAALIPQLRRQGLEVVLVSDPTENLELDIKSQLEKRLPDFPINSEFNIQSTLKELAKWAGGEKKRVVLVIDQFEQWLHQKPYGQQKAIVEALRNCDGYHFCCLLISTEKYTNHVDEFIQEVGERRQENVTTFLVSPLPINTAREVLKQLGIGYGCLHPNAQGILPLEQENLLSEAIDALREIRSVRPIRLALFSHTLADVTWNTSMLQSLRGQYEGGMWVDSLGIRFLNSTFSSEPDEPTQESFAPHKPAAIKILGALLSEDGAEMKGVSQSYSTLLQVSGYESSPKKFDDLLGKLNELRLIRIADDAPKDTRDTRYQLAHDYLEVSVRNWIVNEKSQDSKGRAELLVEEKARLYGHAASQPTPSMDEWFSIIEHVPFGKLNRPQLKMMKHCSERLISDLLTTDSNILLSRISGNVARTYRDDLVQTVESELELARSGNDRTQQLNALLILHREGNPKTKILYERLLKCDSTEVKAICTSINLYLSSQSKKKLKVNLLRILERPKNQQASMRLRAAAAIAFLWPLSLKGRFQLKSTRSVISEKVFPEAAFDGSYPEVVASDLINVPAGLLGGWLTVFAPVKKTLIPEIVKIYLDHDRSVSERGMAADILAKYAQGNAHLLADLVMDAEVDCFHVLFNELVSLDKRSRATAICQLQDELSKPAFPTSRIKSKKDYEVFANDNDRLAKRKSNSVIALARLKQTDFLWGFLEPSPDPRLRTFLIHRLAPLHIDPDLLVERLKMSRRGNSRKSLGIRQAVILSLGEYSADEFTDGELNPNSNDSIVTLLKKWYYNDRDAGIHSATEWILRRWGIPLLPIGIDGLDQQKQRRDNADSKTCPWFVNSQNQTMVVISANTPYMIGAPIGEDFWDDAPRHKRKIAKSFAIGAKLITWRDFKNFQASHAGERISAYSESEDCPVYFVTWHMAAAYCNFLSISDQLTPLYKIEGRWPAVRATLIETIKPGYRLPTESEMEYATRADTCTARFMGETEEYMDKYISYQKNSANRSQTVGKLKPNDWGLFDAIGNGYVWCQDVDLNYSIYNTKRIVVDPGCNPKANSIIDPKAAKLITAKYLKNHERIVRGGASFDAPTDVRSAYRYKQAPTNSKYFIGLRVVRTF